MFYRFTRIFFYSTLLLMLLLLVISFIPALYEQLVLVLLLPFFSMSSFQAPALVAFLLPLAVALFSALVGAVRIAIKRNVKSEDSDVQKKKIFYLSFFLSFLVAAVFIPVALMFMSPLDNSLYFVDGHRLFFHLKSNSSILNFTFMGTVTLSAVSAALAKSAAGSWSTAQDEKAWWAKPLRYVSLLVVFLLLAFLLVVFCYILHMFLNHVVSVK